MPYFYNTEDIEPGRLAAFVQQHPEGNIYQTPEMYEVYKNAKNYEPVLVVKTNDRNEIEASFLVSLFSEKSGLMGNLTRRAMTLACPLITGPVTYTEIFNETHRIIGNKALYLKISNIFDKSGMLPEIKKIGYEFEPHLNFLIDLEKDEQTLWKNLHETRRKQIKRGYNRGIRVEVTDHITDVDAYYAILDHTYQRVKLPMDDISLIASANEIFSPKKYIHYISAYFEDKLIAHRMVLTYKDYIYDWYAGNLTEFNHLYPNDVLVWETLKWGMQNGYKTFNFGGAGHPDKPYGVREFKRKFGGQLVEYGYFSRILNPFTYNTLKKVRSLLERS